jgi:hypothetical protein
MAAGFNLALSNPIPGQEAEFNDWYGGDHFVHGLQVPGILAGQRFRRADKGPWPAGKHDYLMIWELDDPKFALEQLASARGGEHMPISAAIDMTTVQPPTMWLRASVRNAGRVVTDTASRGPVVFVLVNALQGEATAFEKALISGGLAAIADTSGVIAADFLTLADEQIRGNARKYAYGLLIELADEATALAALPATLSALPHCDQQTWLAPVFRPLAGRLTAKDMAAEHAA